MRFNTFNALLGKYSPHFRKEKYFVNYDVEQFTVANISQRLKNRGLTSSGTKASLNSVLAASDQSLYNLYTRI